MMLLPMLKGGRVAKEWQPISELMCSAPSSRCTSLIAENSGRSGHPVHSPDGRCGTSAANLPAGTSAASRAACGGGCCGLYRARRPAAEKFADAFFEHVAGVFSGHRQNFLADDARRATAR